MTTLKEIKDNQEVSFDVAEQIVTLFSENNVTILQAKQALIRAEKMLNNVVIQSTKEK